MCTTEITRIREWKRQLEAIARAMRETPGSVSGEYHTHEAASRIENAVCDLAEALCED